MVRLPTNDIYRREYRENQVLLLPIHSSLQHPGEVSRHTSEFDEMVINGILSSHNASWLRVKGLSNGSESEKSGSSSSFNGISLFELLFSAPKNTQLDDKRGKLRRYDLPRKTATRPPTHGWRRFYIALNLYKNEDMILFLTDALVAFIEDELAPFFDVSTSVVVSIFTNDSKDRTAVLVERVLIPRLLRAGVRNVFATVEGTCLAYTKVPKRLSRIEWMACVRNKALEPLYTWGMRLFSPSFYTESRKCEQSGACDSMNSYLNGTFLERYLMGDGVLNSSESSASFSFWEKEVRDDPYGDVMVVLFFNDIFFRPQDITTLLESVEEPVIASRTRPDGTVSEGNNDGPPLRNKPTASAATGTGTTFDMACGMDYYYSFYDRWVARDRVGDIFLSHMPYSDEPETRDALYRVSSAAHTAQGRRQAVPVKCCWNGVAALRGRLFISPVMKPDGTERRRTSSREEQKGDSYIGNTRVRLGNRSRKMTKEIRMWHGGVYRHEPNAHKQLARYHRLTVLQRLYLKRERWAIRVQKLARGTGLTLPHPDLPIVPSALRKAYTGEFDAMARDGRNYDFADANSEQSVYYRATMPAIRFRHSAVPSFGATKDEKYTVRDDVCVSSECLLVCEDIMQAALLEGRVPLILMNPNVRVAYEPEHFDRVTGWMYNSHSVFVLTYWVRRLTVWISALLGISDDGASVIGTTSAADDWTADDINRTQLIQRATPDGSMHSLLINVTHATSMSCYSPGVERSLTFSSFFVCALLVGCIAIVWRLLGSVFLSCAWVRETLYFQFSTFVRVIRWRVRRALVHPRANMAFGCPRVVAVVVRCAAKCCGWHWCLGYEIPLDPETIDV
ncbi:hypothetical protein DQ04_03371020 [Trypanosoma grayi]|uniref:hypothetical protein n=1 Tax=Trypanosoma grayi TaxID=71804 RepID=UPI0004F42A06|nr:hypothetical protein DQ04_03371020 [Trypanosoma grayi]KEG10722.1 hypothetical protein DQ04_03371020 [Trypanosoma grayi]